METGFRRGRLEDGSVAPLAGERLAELARLADVRIEQILSGELEEPVSFDQAHDEWVVLLDGGATMIVDGDQFELRPGDWLLLPAGCPHTVVETQPGTSWVAVHVGEDR
ncbi:MAG TPA: cupin domain-containing protein [Gaiellaceae bacterium]|nr:cupin domain-containing protein [Gaiellaceae bacterium]